MWSGLQNQRFFEEMRSMKVSMAVLPVDSTLLHLAPDGACFAPPATHPTTGIGR